MASWVWWIFYLPDMHLDWDLLNDIYVIIIYLFIVVSCLPMCSVEEQMTLDIYIYFF